MCVVKQCTVTVTYNNKPLLVCVQQASYGKKNGVWYGAAVPAQGWKPPLSRKSSIADAGDVPPPGGGSKPNSGRVIRIINNQDHTVQVQ